MVNRGTIPLSLGAYSVPLWLPLNGRSFGLAHLPFTIYHLPTPGDLLTVNKR